MLMDFNSGCWAWLITGSWSRLTNDDDGWLQQWWLMMIDIYIYICRWYFQLKLNYKKYQHTSTINPVNKIPTTCWLLLRPLSTRITSPKYSAPATAWPSWLISSCCIVNDERNRLRSPPVSSRVHSPQDSPVAKIEFTNFSQEVLAIYFA